MSFVAFACWQPTQMERPEWVVCIQSARGAFGDSDWTYGSDSYRTCTMYGDGKLDESPRKNLSEGGTSEMSQKAPLDERRMPSER